MQNVKIAILSFLELYVFVGSNTSVTGPLLPGPTVYVNSIFLINVLIRAETNTRARLKEECGKYIRNAQGCHFAE